jgi:DNA-binding GntR family transcriptional regulator
MLVRAVKRIILPLFAFVVIRVQGSRTEREQWIRSLEQHKRIIDALRTRDPVFAERLVAQAINFFREETTDVVQSASRVLKKSL